jgi:hypothetical protein
VDANYSVFLIRHFFQSVIFHHLMGIGSKSMAHASPDDIRAVMRDLATRDVLCIESPGEKAVYLHIFLGHKRSAIIGAGVITAQSFKRALDAFAVGRMIGIVGPPSFLHKENEEKLVSEIQKAQEGGKSLSNDDISDWVFSFFLISFFFTHF